MLKFDKFNNQQLLECKQRGLLYHVTGLRSAEAIISSNKMKGSQYKDEDVKSAISTTRNKNFVYDTRNKDISIQFVLDGDKITNNHKVQPFDYWYREYSKGVIEDEPQIKDEDEELIILKGDSLDDIKKYISKINMHIKGETNEEDSKSVDHFIEILDDKDIKYSIVYD